MESRSYLCDDLVRDILIQLPTKSLLRFSSVSKSWRSLIVDPCFLRERKSLNLIIIEKTRPLEPWFSSDLRSPRNLQKLDLPVELDRNIHNYRVDLDRPTGSCNGLLLLNDYDDTRLWMLNLFTRECHVIDIPKVLSPQVNFLVCTNYGFGYSSVNDDYKVIMIFSYQENHMPVYVTYVYSLRNDAWRRTPFCVDPSFLIRGIITSGVLVGGKLYWMIAYPHNNYELKILAFDVASEEFCVVSSLPKAEDANTCFNSLTELGGRLAVTEFSVKPYIAVAIWVLNESRWVQQRMVKTCDGIGKYEYMVPIAYSKSGDEILMRNSFSCVWHNKKNGELDELMKRKDPVKIIMCLDNMVSISAYRGRRRQLNNMLTHEFQRIDNC